MANGSQIKNRSPKLDFGPYKYGFSDRTEYAFAGKAGLSRHVVEEISSLKGEPQWMREFRLRSYHIFTKKAMPTWGADLSDIDFNKIRYFMRATDFKARSWNEVPKTIKDTFDKLGVPEAERKFFAGVAAQYDAEVVYHNMRKEWEAQGVIFVDTDTALQKYPDIVKKYFGTIVPPADNKFAALNSAVWSGGSFVYVPAGVHVKTPLQAYFRINAKNVGQFERTLIIAEEGSFVSYLEGCTAPVYTTDSLHSAVVEIIVKKNARVRYTTVQNWSNNVYNLVTKRAFAYEDAIMEWVDGNLGSKITMKFPSVFLMGRGAKADILSIAFAGRGQHQDAGGKTLHLAPETTSQIVSKSVSKDGGRTSYRGLVKIARGAEGAKSKVKCDALILDTRSRSDTYPAIDVDEDNAVVEHEATASRLNEEQLFYLQSRGLPEAAAATLIVSGFIEPFVKELPLDYAVEMNKLIQMQMEGSVG